METAARRVARTPERLRVHRAGAGSSKTQHRLGLIDGCIAKA
ncbi:hypothetical protein ACQEVG_16500 [Streptomyces sp. CA-135486]